MPNPHSGSISIRNASDTDEKRWRELWQSYLTFYGACVSPKVTEHTWQRIIAPSSPLVGRLAAFEGCVVGFSISVIHEGTWVPDAVCYLEDLFVDESQRGRGIGKALIDDLKKLGSQLGWSTLYWHTRRDNPARHLYDGFVTADDFVRYRLHL